MEQPAEPAARAGGSGSRLFAALVEWMMELPEGRVIAEIAGPVVRSWAQTAWFLSKGFGGCHVSLLERERTVASPRAGRSSRRSLPRVAIFMAARLFSLWRRAGAPPLCASDVHAPDHPRHASPAQLAGALRRPLCCGVLAVQFCSRRVASVRSLVAVAFVVVSESRVWR